MLPKARIICCFLQYVSMPWYTVHDDAGVIFAPSSHLAVTDYGCFFMALSQHRYLCFLMLQKVTHWVHTLYTEQTAFFKSLIYCEGNVPLYMVVVVVFYWLASQCYTTPTR